MPRKHPKPYRKRLNRFLRNFGVTLDDLDGVRPRKESSLQLLRNAGLAPRTVFDVGVHTYGTPGLYAAFPDAKHVLIEPVVEFRQDIINLSSTIEDVDLIWAAASDAEGKATLNVTPGLTHSSLKGSEGSEGSSYEVDVVTLDGLVKNRSYEPSFLIKVDVDGRDLDVLKGAKSILQQTDCVIVEATTQEILPRLDFLTSNGLCLWDIVDICYAGDVLWQVDLVFLSDRLQELLPRKLDAYWNL